MSHGLETLRHEVRNAFAARPYPGDDHLALSRDGCPGYEGETVRAFFQGKRWEDLSLESIRSSEDLDPNAFMAFMKAEGLAYFLPALLLMALEPAGLFEMGEPLAFFLTAPGLQGSGAWEAHFSRLVSLLSSKERLAVKHVLEQLSAEYSRRGVTLNQAQQALDAHWAIATDGPQ